MDSLSNALPPAAAAATANTSGSYLDFGALGRLKGQAKTDAKAATRETAQQFEAMFLQMMMKTMRDAIPKSGLNESQAEDTFQGMFDKEVSLAMAKRNSLGLADMLVINMPDGNANSPSTLQMLQARQGKGMPLQTAAQAPMPLQTVAPVLAPLPKTGGAMPLTARELPISPSSDTASAGNSDGAKP
jgi:flagellar protein FlgJ